VQGNKEFSVQSPSPRRALPRPEDFPHRVSDTIRYGDLDRQNHVNNAVFSTFYETGRVFVIRNPELGLCIPDTEWVLVRAAIDFHGEMRWPGTVEIGTGIARIGRTSLTFDQGLFVDGICKSSGQTTCVLVSATTRKPLPFSKELSARMRASAPAAPGPA
jgi:acyl-CoA thioester hydrolase